MVRFACIISISARAICAYGVPGWSALGILMLKRLPSRFPHLMAVVSGPWQKKNKAKVHSGIGRSDEIFSNVPGHLESNDREGQ